MCTALLGTVPTVYHEGKIILASALIDQWGCGHDGRRYLNIKIKTVMTMSEFMYVPQTGPESHAVILEES